MSELAELRARLEAERKRIAVQIAGYPPPIPACDAQFNHLLERRERIQNALALLGRLEAELKELLDPTSEILQKPGPGPESAARAK